MSSFSQLVKFQPLMIYPYASIEVNYTLVGIVDEAPVRVSKMTNTTNQDVLISYDGVIDHDVLPNNSFVLYDFSSNSGRENVIVVPKGTMIYVKYISAPNAGAVYVTTISARGD